MWCVYILYDQFYVVVVQGLRGPSYGVIDRVLYVLHCVARTLVKQIVRGSLSPWSVMYCSNLLGRSGGDCFLGLLLLRYRCSREGCVIV